MKTTKSLLATLLLLAAIAAPITYAEAKCSTTNNIEMASKNSWDSILDSFDKYVDSYIAVMKKVQAGDMMAMTESVTLLQKTNELSKKLENAEDDLTPEQLSRYLKIVAKLAKSLEYAL